MIFLFVFTCLSASVVIKSVSTVSTHPIVVILAFDGFRPEYLERGVNPVLKDVIQRGSTTVRMINQFPTLTFPNLHSIATGMYPETHGVLGKRVFDKTGACISYGEDFYSYNKNITPIWILNELSGEGRHSGTMMWAAAEFPNHNRLPTFQWKLNKSTSWGNRVDEVISWLTNAEKPANLVAMYFEEPDGKGHQFGPNSDSILPALKQVDDIIAHYFQQLELHNISDVVNTIILSDHGMTTISDTGLINLTNAVKEDEFLICGSNPVYHVRPKPGFEKKILEQFKQISREKNTFDVIESGSMRSHWHLNNSERKGSFLLVAKKPFFFIDANSSSGAHGYDEDNKDMYPIFIAQGPAFKRNFTAQSFQNIDIYPLVSQILGLCAPQVPINGSIANINNILRERSGIIGEKSSLMLILGIFTGFAFILLILLVLVLKGKCSF